MRIQRTFHTRLSQESALQHAAAAMEQAGYRPVHGGPQLHFKRGSRLGSYLSFSIKGWDAHAQIRSAVEPNGDILIHYQVDVDTTGQWVTRKEERKWAAEADQLVQALGGFTVDDGLSDPVYRAMAQIKEEGKIKNGANWFYWIAGLSLVNTLLYILGLEWSFIIGLGATQFVDVIAQSVAEEFSGNAYVVIRSVGFAIDLIIAGIFCLFGYLAARRSRAAFILGMAFYLLDAGILLMILYVPGILFHLFGLGGIASGYIALVKAQGEGVRQPAALS